MFFCRPFAGSEKDITGMSGNLAMISKLKGVSYHLKSPEEVNATLRTSSLANMQADTAKQQVKDFKMMKIDSDLYSRQHRGFLAQDVQKVLPDLVYEDKDGVLSVDYVSMIPILVESMKELNEKVVKLERENADLRRKLGVK